MGSLYRSQHELVFVFKSVVRRIGTMSSSASTAGTAAMSGPIRVRPPSVANLATILRKALNERVVVSENGRRRSINKLEAAVKQVVNKAASGDQKFNPLLLALIQLVEGRAEATASSEVRFSETERRLIEHIHERASRNKPGGQDD